jgi:hypothetical protein
MEAITSLKTFLTIYQTIWRHNPAEYEKTFVSVTLLEMTSLHLGDVLVWDRHQAETLFVHITIISGGTGLISSNILEQH